MTLLLATPQSQRGRGCARLSFLGLAPIAVRSRVLAQKACQCCGSRNRPDRRFLGLPQPQCGRGLPDRKLADPDPALSAASPQRGRFLVATARSGIAMTALHLRQSRRTNSETLTSLSYTPIEVRSCVARLSFLGLAPIAVRSRLARTAKSPPRTQGGYASKSSVMPMDLISINQQRFIFERLAVPYPSTRPHPIVRMIDEFGANRIQVSVLDPLPKHLLAPKQSRVRMFLPDHKIRAVALVRYS